MRRRFVGLFLLCGVSLILAACDPGSKEVSRSDELRGLSAEEILDLVDDDAATVQSIQERRTDTSTQVIDPFGGNLDDSDETHYLTIRVGDDYYEKNLSPNSGCDDEPACLPGPFDETLSYRGKRYVISENGGWVDEDSFYSGTRLTWIVSDDDEGSCSASEASSEAYDRYASASALYSIPLFEIDAIERLDDVTEGITPLWRLRVETTLSLGALGRCVRSVWPTNTRATLCILREAVSRSDQDHHVALD